MKNKKIKKIYRKSNNNSIERKLKPHTHGERIIIIIDIDSIINFNVSRIELVTRKNQKNHLFRKIPTTEHTHTHTKL